MFKITIFSLPLAVLFFCQYASAQEQPESGPLKRIHLAYKYHIVDDEREVAKTFPKNGHSVQLGFNFNVGKPGFLYDMGFFTLVFDYAHLRKYRDKHVSSAGFDYSIYPSKIFAWIRGRPYDNTPRMERWVLSGGRYKTLDKYHLNYVSNLDLSYRVRIGKVDLFPKLGITTFDEVTLSGRKEGEHYMDFFSFGLAAHF